MPRIRAVDLMLAGSVVLWALNLTLSKYVLTHGLAPLAYSVLRYGAASAIFLSLTRWRERRVLLDGRRAWLVAVTAALILFTNQVGFVYALRFTTASTVGLLFGATPIITALIALSFGLERMTRRFTVAALISFAGVALVALGEGGGLSGNLKGDLLALWSAASWGAYSVAIATLIREWSPMRVSAVVLPLTTLLLLSAGFRQVEHQDYGAVGWKVWAVFAVAVLGPLVLTNFLWFTALDRVGPSHATLFATLQPFVAVLFAVVLLSESLTLVQVAGGAAIALGIALSWRGQPAPVQVE